VVQKYEYRMRVCRKYRGQSVSWKLCNSTQHCVPWKTKFPEFCIHYPVLNSPPPVLSTSQTNAFYVLQYYLRSILIPSSHVRICLSSCSIPFRFPRQNPPCISILPHACHRPFHLTLLDFITLVIFGEDCRPFDIMKHADRIFKMLNCWPCW